MDRLENNKIIVIKALAYLKIYTRKDIIKSLKSYGLIAFAESQFTRFERYAEEVKPSTWHKASESFQELLRKKECMVFNEETMKFEKDETLEKEEPNVKNQNNTKSNKKKKSSTKKIFKQRGKYIFNADNQDINIHNA